MDPEPPDGNDSAKAPAPRPQVILHANEGAVATSHPSTLRKRSAVVLLVAVTIGVGATTYAAVTANQNCEQDPNKPNATTTCNRSSTSGSRYGFLGSSPSDNSTSRSTSPAETSTPRAGFGAHGAIHGSTSS